MPICFSILFLLAFLLIENYGKCALRKESVIGRGFKHLFFESLTDKPTNTPRGLTDSRSFPRRFNVESMWCVCREGATKL